MKMPILKTLCIAIAVANMQSVFALEALDDDTLSETTGEGIALLPEGFSVSMNGADTTNGGRGTYGAGYTRFIPVGPLTAAATAKGYQKADVWLYGASLGQSKKNLGVTINSTDWGVPFGGIGTGAADFGRAIDSWGTADNPWLIKTVTTASVPDFVGANKSVTHLDIEAPLYHVTLPASGSAASSAYNLKLGFWSDFYMRNPATPESGYAGLSNRLRLAFTWDGFSINGSNVKIFQTLDGVTPAMGGTYNATLKINGTPTVKTFNYGLSTSYNKTLGVAGLVRLNSGTTDTRRATIGLGSITREIIQLDYYPVRNYNTATQTRSGLYVEGTVLATNTVASGVGTMTSGTAGATNNAPTYVAIAGTITPAKITANETTNNNAAHSIGLDQSYIPMTDSSLRGPSTDPDAASLPANTHALGTFPYKPSYPGTMFDGGVCTSQADGTASGNQQFGQCLNNEGFTTRRLKARTTNTWTPPAARSVMRFSTQELLGGVFGTGTPALGGATGTMPDFRPNATAEGIFVYDANINLVLGSLYQPIMLSTDGNNFSFEVARIPNNVNVYSKIYTRYPGDTGDGAVTYQGSTCNVHQCGAAVTLGGVNYQGSSATHSSITIGSTVYNAGTNQLSAYTGADSYGVSFGESVAQSGLYSEVFTDYTQVWNRTRAVVSVQTSTSGCGFFGGSACYEDRFGAWGAWAAVTPKAAYTSPTHPSLSRANPYETTFNQNYNNQILGIHTTMPQGVNGIANAINGLSPLGASATNNFGSAVIDGLLIQHLKFSTTGL